MARCVEGEPIKSKPIHLARKPSQEVKRSNVLIRAEIPFDSIWELRIIDIVAAVVRKDDEELQNYCIHCQDFRAGKVGGRDLEMIDRACSNLTKSNVKIPKQNGKGFTYYCLFPKCEYDRGFITVQIHPDLKSHFIGLRKHYTVYGLFEALAIPSSYSKRIFEFLKSWDDKPEVSLPLDKLQDMLNVPDSLKRQYSNFKARVLEPAQKHISKHTSLRFEYAPQKTGRKVVGIRFIMSPKRIHDFLIDQKKKEAEKIDRKMQRELERSNKIIKKAIHCLRSAKPCERDDSSKVCAACVTFYSDPVAAKLDYRDSKHRSLKLKE